MCQNYEVALFPLHTRMTLVSSVPCIFVYFKNCILIGAPGFMTAGMCISTYCLWKIGVVVTL